MKSTTILKKRYDREYKMDAARMVVDGGRAIKDVAADLGVAPVTIRTWVASYRQSQAIGAPGSGHISATELQLKLANDEIRKLKIQVDFLKKTMAFFDG